VSTRTVYDPFYGQDVQISDKLTDRLRGKYASGPHLPNGNPEFGWRQFQAPPIQHDAAARIEELEAALGKAIDYCDAATHGDGQYADERSELIRVWRGV
jgi:hypothetical protein